MKITGLHLLLTYQCPLECDHCFVWGSPRQSGVMPLTTVRHILLQAVETGTIDSIYFEGGEPFLYYATLLAGVRAAHELGFSVGIVSNGFWAIGAADALEALRPLAGLVSDLSISSDQYHWGAPLNEHARRAAWAAEQLGIPLGVISIAQPAALGAGAAAGQILPGESGLMVRGRAAQMLAAAVPHHPWDTYTACPYEDLANPGRVHVDPFGYVHVCQGIAIGNLLETPLVEISARYVPETHPIVGPLLAGGPAELARRYAVPPAAAYADACHLCDQARHALRARFPGSLAPDAMYGVGL